MTRGTELKVKSWVIEKADKTARHYDRCIATKRNADGIGSEEVDGFVTVWIEEFITESEKAINVVLDTENGSGWKLWIPKSQIM